MNVRFLSKADITCYVANITLILSSLAPKGDQWSEKWTYGQPWEC